MKKSVLAAVLIIAGIIGLGCFYFTSYERGADTPQHIAPSSSTNFDASIVSITPVARVSTRDWKICRNEEYGYEFKYPKEWTLAVVDATNSQSQTPSDCSGALSLRIVKSNIPQSHNETEQCVPLLSVLFTSKDDIQEWNNDQKILDDQYILDLATRYSTTISRKYSIGNYQAFVYEASTEYPCQPVYPVSIAKNDGIIQIQGTGIKEDVLETIFSTLRLAK
jgi:hypothetical protein